MKVFTENTCIWWIQSPNMHFDREIQAKIKSKIGGGKAIILIGPRQVGETTLNKEIIKGKNFLFLNGDEKQQVIWDSNSN